jgi:hypothetical protein
MAVVCFQAAPAIAETLQIGQNGTPINVTSSAYTFNVNQTSPGGGTYSVSGELEQVINAGFAGMLLTSVTITDTGTTPVGDIIYFASDLFTPVGPGSAYGGAGLKGVYTNDANSTGGIGYGLVQVMCTFVDPSAVTNPFILVTALPAATNASGPTPFFPPPIFAPMPNGVDQLSAGLEFGLGGFGDQIMVGALGDIVSTPEPSPMLLLGWGLISLISLLGLRRRGSLVF